MRHKLTNLTLIILLLASVVPFAFAAVRSQAKAQISRSASSETVLNQTSQSYKNCLPKQVTQVELMGTVTDNHNAYYLLSIYSNQNQFWEELIQVNPNGQCSSLLSQSNPEDWPSKYLPMDVAQKLALKRYTKLINKAGGKQAFQQALLQETKNDPQPEAKDYMPPEYVWALKQLGIQIPFEYKVLDSAEGVPQQ